jgi:hypothetical protein
VPSEYSSALRCMVLLSSLTQLSYGRIPLAILAKCRA